MNHPFYEEHDQVIEYGEFCECGWSVGEYLTYCDLIAQLRSALIVEETYENNTPTTATSGDKMILRSALILSASATVSPR